MSTSSGAAMPGYQLRFICAKGYDVVLLEAERIAWGASVEMEAM